MKIKHLLSLIFVAVPLIVSAQITIDETNFPDENFRNYLLNQYYGKDGVITDEEIKGITFMDISSRNISSLEGIEHFTALTRLSCSFNSLTSLDVSKNTELTELHGHFTKLTTLNVSNNKNLKSLALYFNQLTELDVSNNTALTYLDCDYGQLTALDVSNNKELTNLTCCGNQLTELDVSNNKALTYLRCGQNKLTALDISNNTALTFLDCWNNQLTSLDVSKNTELTGLSCETNSLTSLDVSKNTELTGLSCSYNSLTSLDVSKNTELTDLHCSYNSLTSLDVSKNTALTYLECYGNQIQGISMDAFINSLPNNINKGGVTFDDDGTGSGSLNDNYADGETSGFYNRLYIFFDSYDGNICTRSQVAAIKAKGWTPYDYSFDKEYEGCDDPTSVTVSVNSDGLTTYCPVFDVDFSHATEIAAYKASVSANTVYLEKVDAVAAGEGVLLRSLNGGEATEELPIEAAEKHEDNAFVGTLSAIVLKEKVDNATNFILGWNSGTLGFYKANNTPLPAWQAYLPVENYNPAKALRMVFSDATDINEIIAPPATDDDAFYTLNGVRVTTPTKGIYIKNGKKIVIK